MLQYNKKKKEDDMHKLIENRKIIEKEAFNLWQGNAVDISTLNATIIEVSNTILNIANGLNEEDKNTTIIYVRNALSNFELASNSRDNFLLSDCLYFEWRELISVYIDVIGE